MRKVAQLAAWRALQLIPVLLGVTFLAFLLVDLLPGSPAIAILGANATNASIASLNQELGLNKPFWTRYGLWLWHAVHGNLGKSLLDQQSVITIIRTRAPVTIELVVLAMVVALCISIPAAILAVRKPLGIFDWTARSLSITALSLPSFILALILLRILAVQFQLLPTTGFVPLTQGIWPNIKSILMPVLAISFGLFGAYSRILRGDLMAQLRGEDYIHTATSKGISHMRVLVYHALKNSSLALITVVGSNLGVLIGGTVIVEGIFDLPGLGQQLQQSILNRDLPVVQGIVALIGLIVVLSNLLADIVYLLLDPRIR